jgi:hypothetical protein
MVATTTSCMASRRTGRQVPYRRPRRRQPNRTAGPERGLRARCPARARFSRSACALRDAGLIAACRVRNPDLRQVKPHAAHRRSARRTPRPGSCPPSPRRPDYCRHPDRAIPPFREATLVDDQATIRLAAKHLVRIPADLHNDRLVVPRRVADEVLELLCAAALNRCGHRGELADLGLHQSTQVAQPPLRSCGGTGAEEWPVARIQGREGICNPLDQRCRQVLSAHAVTRRSASVISPLQSIDAVEAH